MSSTAKPKQEALRKYIFKSDADAKINDHDPICYFLVKEVLMTAVSKANLEQFALQPMTYSRPEPQEPVEHPDIDFIRGENPDLAERLDAEFIIQYDKYDKRFKIWVDLKDKFETKQSLFATIISKHIGPAVLNIAGVRVLFDQKAYFEALKYLDEYFLFTGPNDTRTRLFNILQTVYFEFTVSMLEFTQLIDKLATIYAMLDGGRQATDHVKVQYLIGAVERGEGNFSFEGNLMDVGGFSWDDACGYMITRAGKQKRSPFNSNKKDKNQHRGDRQQRSSKEDQQQPSGGFQSHHSEAKRESKQANKKGNGKKKHKPGKCNDCGKSNGHWAGDPECENPKAGRKPFVGSEGHNASSNSKSAAGKQHHDHDSERGAEYLDLQERYLKMEAELKKTHDLVKKQGHQAQTRSIMFSESIEDEDDFPSHRGGHNASRDLPAWFSRPSTSGYGPREFNMHVRGGFDATDWRAQSTAKLPAELKGPGIAASSPAKRNPFSRQTPSDLNLDGQFTQSAPKPPSSAPPRHRTFNTALDKEVEAFLASKKRSSSSQPVVVSKVQFSNASSVALDSDDESESIVKSSAREEADAFVASRKAALKAGENSAVKSAMDAEFEALRKSGAFVPVDQTEQEQQHPHQLQQPMVATESSSAEDHSSSPFSEGEMPSLEELPSESDQRQPFHMLVTRHNKDGYPLIDTLQPGAKLNTIRRQAHMVGKSNRNKVTGAVFDTGATDNMVASSAGLTNVVPFTEANDKVYMGGNKNFGLPIVGRGVDGILSDVLIVPQLERDLISGPQLMIDDFMQIYVGNRAFVFDMKRPGMPLVESGTLQRDKLVHRDVEANGPTFEVFCKEMLALSNKGGIQPRSKSAMTAVVPQPQPCAADLSQGRFSEQLSKMTARQFVYGKAKNRPLAARAHVGNEMVVLHQRTMHAGSHKLLNMAKFGTAIGICTTLKELQAAPLGDCVACHLGKFSKFPAPMSFSLEPERNMQVISSDIKGPFRVRSLLGSYYFQLHHDRKSKVMFVNFHKTKDTAAEELMALQNKYATPLGLKIAVMQSDSDALYKDRKLRSYASENSVELQYTAPYRHEGSIESQMKVVLDMVRTVLADSGMAEYHWQTLVEAAVHVLNRLPTASNPRTCPMTELTGRLYDISGWIPLGYPATAMNHAEEGRTTLEPKGVECTVVGYAPESNAYKIVTKTGRLLIRKDVIVDENWAVLQRRRHQQQHLQPVADLLLIDAEERGARDDIEVPSPKPFKAVVPLEPPAEPPPVRHSGRVSVAPDRLSLNSERESLRSKPVFGGRREMFASEKLQPLPPLPRNMSEMLQSKSAYEWLHAVNAEFAELIERGVIVPVEPGEKTDKPFRSKIVPRVTRAHDAVLGDHLKFKARVVALGYSSILGVHYDDTYSPTMLFKSLLIVLTIAMREGWLRTNIDVGNAYLEAARLKALYMWLPIDWTQGRKIKVRLARNLYGLKDAGLLWYLVIDRILQKEGYKRSVFDPCVYHKAGSILALFVDDLAITGNRASEVKRIKAAIASQVKKLKDMGQLSKFIGIEMEQDGDHLVLTQLETSNAYINEYVRQGKSVKHVPISALHQLDKFDEEDTAEWTPIWDIVGKIRYMADRTRHDLQYVASKLGTKSSMAPPTYQKAAMDVMSYLRGTKDLALRLGGRDKIIKLFAYADASFVAGDDSRSQLGYCMFLNRDSGAVVARSIKDKTVSLSSTESEIKALCEAIKEIIWIRGLLAELGYPQLEPTVVYQDNQSSIRLSERIGSEARTRHIVNRLNFIRQEIEHGTVQLEYIPTGDMVADILTGPRDRGLFEYLRSILLEGHQRGKEQRASSKD
eukprot:gene25234-31665_t